MPVTEHHLLICGKSRKAGSSRASCDPGGNGSVRKALKKAIKKAGLSRSTRTNEVGCLDECEHGPVVVVYPAGFWYGNVQPEDAARIVEETLIGGRALPDLLIADSCLNNSRCPHRKGKG